MVVDSSAIISVLLGEPRAPAVAAVLGAARSPIMSAATAVELFIVAEARAGAAGADAARALLDSAGVDIIPVGDVTVQLALESWRAFGKGRHPAALNFGDCFSHALAVQFELPLLCVGDDFARTGHPIVVV
jgi:ribonuclease VapC